MFPTLPVLNSSSGNHDDLKDMNFNFPKVFLGYGLI